MVNTGVRTDIPTRESYPINLTTTSIVVQNHLKVDYSASSWIHSNSSFKSPSFSSTAQSNLSSVHNFNNHPSDETLAFVQNQHLLDGNELDDVSIEQKIEQALDLVKTHLVFTVKDEIDSLKEEIHRLNSRKVQLETENKFLRFYASPETLAHLSIIE